MTEQLVLNYSIAGDDFTKAGEAAADFKTVLKKTGVPPDIIRRAAICMYEGEINMVIHADGGDAEIIIGADKIEIILADRGPGIPDIELAMQEGYTTAPENIRSLGFGAGMGLPNMKRYSDGFDIKSAPGVGTTVKMTIMLPKNRE
ncbi:MAG: anti-sigma regulatory factor [Clostridiales bacterium]|jgi:anti-sigma regulatory factor (Ser/Thr protein kinase)|nr:anti-sigma regulatory factor [Clostridiales bacterium]